MNAVRSNAFELSAAAAPGPGRSLTARLPGLWLAVIGVSTDGGVRRLSAHRLLALQPSGESPPVPLFPSEPELDPDPAPAAGCEFGPPPSSGEPPVSPVVVGLGVDGLAGSPPSCVALVAPRESPTMETVVGGPSELELLRQRAWGRPPVPCFWSSRRRRRCRRLRFRCGRWARSPQPHESEYRVCRRVAGRPWAGCVARSSRARSRGSPRLPQLIVGASLRSTTQIEAVARCGRRAAPRRVERDGTPRRLRSELRPRTSQSRRRHRPWQRQGHRRRRRSQ